MPHQHYPSALLQRAVNEFSRLPGVGQKTALRLVLHLLRQEPEAVESFAQAMVELRQGIHYCARCHSICDTELCDICANPRRDASTVCVVENVQDVMAVENTMQYQGVYHVLGGVISPMDGIGPQDIQAESLFRRVAEGGIREVILALSPTMEGDTTNYYIYRKLQDTGIRISVIARGVAQNDELQYTDEVTLGRAIAGRTEFKL